MEGIWEYILFLLLLFPPYSCFPVTSVRTFQRFKMFTHPRFTNLESFPPFLRKSCHLNKTPDLGAVRIVPSPVVEKLGTRS